MRITRNLSYRMRKEVNHLYFMMDPELFRLEKMMVLIPRFTSPGSCLLVHAVKEAPEDAEHDRLMRETMQYIRHLDFLRRFDQYQDERKNDTMQYREIRYRAFFEKELQKRKSHMPSSDVPALIVVEFRVKFFFIQCLSPRFIVTAEVKKHTF